MEYHKARREVSFISIWIHGCVVLTQDHFAFARSFPGLAAGDPLSWLLCLPDSAPSLSARVYSFPSTFLLSGTTRPWSSAGTSYFSEEPCSFCWEKALETKHWALGAYCCWGIIPLRARQIPEQGGTCVHRYPRIYTHMSIKASTCNHVHLY